MKNISESRTVKNLPGFSRHALLVIILFMPFIVSFAAAQEYAIIRTNALTHRQVEILDFDSVKVHCRYADHQFTIPLDSIAQIYNEEYGNFAPPLAVAGMILGGVAGHHSVSDSEEGPARGIGEIGASIGRSFMTIIGMGLGTVTGVIIGKKLSKPKIYQFAGLRRADKYVLLQKLMGRR